MNKPNTICRVCGKEYYCCDDSKTYGAYKAMACSPECFKEYMKRIEEARAPKPKPDNCFKGVHNNYDDYVTENNVKPVKKSKRNSNAIGVEVIANDDNKENDND